MPQCWAFAHKAYGPEMLRATMDNLVERGGYQRELLWENIEELRQVRLSHVADLLAPYLERLPSRFEGICPYRAELALECSEWHRRQKAEGPP
jgi:hypothetical protein